MSPARAVEPFELWRGDPFDLLVEVTRRSVPGDDSTIAPVDLRGYGSTFRAQARPNPDSIVVFEFDVVPFDLAAGKLLLKLSGEQTGQMTGREYHFDIQAYDSADHPQQTIVVGTLRPDGEYTRA